jgi:hypothetical protein
MGGFVPPYLKLIMGRPIYYMQVKISYRQANRVTGERRIWLVSKYTKLSDINKYKTEWIANYYWNASKKKPDILVTEILDMKQVGESINDD